MKVREINEKYRECRDFKLENKKVKWKLKQ